jgi:hypothetical protein
VLPIAPSPNLFLAFVLFDLLDCLVQVGLVHDVVPIEDVSSRMPADRHRHRLLHASLHHISDGGSAQVVEKQSLAFRLFGRLGPQFAKIGCRQSTANLLAIPSLHLKGYGHISAKYV